MEKKMELEIREEQRGFYMGRVARNQTVNVRNTTEKCLSHSYICA